MTEPAFIASISRLELWMVELDGDLKTVTRDITRLRSRMSEFVIIAVGEVVVVI